MRGGAKPLPIARQIGVIEAGRHEEVRAKEVVALLRILRLHGVDLGELRADPLQDGERALRLGEASVAPALVHGALARKRRVDLPEREEAGARMQRQQALQQRRARPRQAQHEQRTVDLLFQDLGVAGDVVLEPKRIRRATLELAADDKRPEQRGLHVVVEGFRARRQRSQKRSRPVVALPLALDDALELLRLDPRPKTCGSNKRAQRIQQANG